MDPESGDWSPVFPGQRAPFQPGNEAGLVHGAYSPRRVEDLAGEIVRDLLESPGCPAHLKEDPDGYAYLLELWGSAMAICRLLRSALTDANVLESLTETLTGEETERRPAPGAMNRKSRSRRTQPVLDALHRHETRAANLSVRLGLDAASRARLGGPQHGPSIIRMWAAQDAAQAAGGD
ncbi:MAG: hypothetical protein ACYCVZ_00730 [Streptosporangiaceae bacterium]